MPYLKHILIANCVILPYQNLTLFITPAKSILFMQRKKAAACKARSPFGYAVRDCDLVSAPKECLKRHSLKRYADHASQGKNTVAVSIPGYERLKPDSSP